MKYLLYALLVIFSISAGYNLDNRQNGKTIVIIGKTCGRPTEQLVNYPDYECSGEYRKYGVPIVVRSEYTVLTENYPSVSDKFGSEVVNESWRIARVAGIDITYNAVAVFSLFILLTWLASMAQRQMDDPLL